MSQLEKKDLGIIINGERYFSIALSTLRLDTILDFELYLPASDTHPPVLFSIVPVICPLPTKNARVS